MNVDLRESLEKEKCLIQLEQLEDMYRASVGREHLLNAKYNALQKENEQLKQENLKVIDVLEDVLEDALEKAKGKRKYQVFETRGRDGASWILASYDSRREAELHCSLYPHRLSYRECIVLSDLKENGCIAAEGLKEDSLRSAFNLKKWEELLIIWKEHEQLNEDLSRTEASLQECFDLSQTELYSQKQENEELTAQLNRAVELIADLNKLKKELETEKEIRLKLVDKYNNLSLDHARASAARKIVWIVYSSTDRLITVYQREENARIHCNKHTDRTYREFHVHDKYTGYFDTYEPL